MEVYKEIANYLGDSSRILFITGAGISVDSGIRSYRGVNGKWTEDKKVEGIVKFNINQYQILSKNIKLFLSKRKTKV
ncbi:hypothetical protein [Candidatus Uabimicrobium sp. HlEnr_7]|uniref:hypothetical protein n=1 Tax=Candidatus Uabimicrobium helgolandensis TaxID=3095367 RepID=UPI0035564BE9